jgi:hypothetical protein
MLSTCCRKDQSPVSQRSYSRGKTYTEVLQVVDAQGIAEEVEESILEHASVAVPVTELVTVDFFESQFCGTAGAAQECQCCPTDERI